METPDVSKMEDRLMRAAVSTRRIIESTDLAATRRDAYEVAHQLSLISFERWPAVYAVLNPKPCRHCAGSGHTTETSSKCCPVVSSALTTMALP